MNDSIRTLEIVLSGGAVLDGRVSVALFTKTIQSIQDVLIQIAKSRLKEDPAKSGPTPANILRECELFLVKVEPGSLRASVELPRKQPTLFPDLPDFAEEALEDTKKSLRAISEENSKEFSKILPNPVYRQRILEKVVKIAPTPDSDYRLEVKIPNEPPISLLRPTKEAIVRLEALPPRPPKEEALGPRRAVVEAKGLAEVDHGDITKWIETYYMDELEFDFEHAWRPREIRVAGMLFRLAHPIACPFQEKGGLLVSEYEPLGILAYGETREEVIRAFSHEFGVLWEAIVQQPDNQLTEDAKILKDKLHKLVIGVEPYASPKDQGH
jgi:hypothetical protein